ncbi:MAG: hypothetical protein P8P83_05570 [Rickettsiaceae bacterium]|nr:hypothetical protein [Rickettsiaceae bacterium]
MKYQVSSNNVLNPHRCLILSAQEQELVGYFKNKLNDLVALFYSKTFQEYDAQKQYITSFIERKSLIKILQIKKEFKKAFQDISMKKQEEFFQEFEARKADVNKFAIPGHETFVDCSDITASKQSELRAFQESQQKEYSLLVHEIKEQARIEIEKEADVAISKIEKLVNRQVTSVFSKFNQKIEVIFCKYLHDKKEIYSQNDLEDQVEMCLQGAANDFGVDINTSIE